MPLSAAQVRNGILLEFAAYIKGRDISFERLRAAVGMDRLNADDPKQSVPLNTVIGLLDEASLALGDPCLGLHFAQWMRPGKSGLIGQLILTAPTVRAALRCVQAYFPVFLTDVEIFVSEGDPARLSWSYPDEVTAPRTQFNLFMAASGVERLRLAAGRDWYPVTVLLECEEPPPPCRDTLLDLFGTSIVFSAGENAIDVDAATLERAMPTADPQLFSLFQELAEKWLKEGAHLPGIVSAVRDELLARLRTNRVDLEDIAASLGMSPRALQWRLDQAGTTFERVRDETRRSLAEYYLRDTDRPLVEIAHELGFSEQSAFTRAAKRWFEKSPKSYRRQYRGPRHDPEGSSPKL